MDIKYEFEAFEQCLYAIEEDIDYRIKESYKQHSHCERREEGLQSR